MDTITRDTLVKVSNLLGFPPEDVAEIHIAPNSVRAVLFERDEHGSLIRVYAGGQPRLRTEVCNVR